MRPVFLFCQVWYVSGFFSAIKKLNVLLSKQIKGNVCSVECGIICAAKRDYLAVLSVKIRVQIL